MASGSPLLICGLLHFCVGKIISNVGFFFFDKMKIQKNDVNFGKIKKTLSLKFHTRSI